jgi:hypothetical protein
MVEAQCWKGNIFVTKKVNGEATKLLLLYYLRRNYERKKTERER